MPALPSTAAPDRSRRMTRAERRDQLIDSAAAVLVERGVAAITMERVAAAAGVSKALPYAHFENATELVTALRDRELDRFGASIVAAVRAARGYEARIVAAVHGYFAFIEQRGDVLVAVLRSLPMTEEEERDRHDPAFFARLFQKELGMSEATATVASGICVAGTAGAVDAWLRDVAGREAIEAITVQAILGVAARVAEAEAAGTIPADPAQP